MKILTLPPQDGPEVVARVLSVRWRTILLTSIVVVAAVAGYLAVVGRSYTATTQVQLAVIGAEPASSQRARAGGLDMTTELDLARSGEAAARTVGAVGGGLTTQQVIKRIGLDADLNSTVLSISWTDRDPDRARAVAAAHAASFLEVRRLLATERVKEITDAINAEIKSSEEALADLPQSVVDQRPDLRARSEVLRTTIASLTTRRATMLGYDASVGRVVTSESEVELIAGPPRLSYLGGAAGAGIFLGLLLALVRERADRRVRGPRHLAEIVAAPVWSPDLSDQGDLRWFGAARLASLVGRDKGTPALLVSSSAPETRYLLAAYRSAQGDVRPDRRVVLIDLDSPRAEVLRSLANVDHVAIAPSARMSKQDVRQLVDQIDLSGAELIGAFHLPEASRGGDVDMRDIVTPGSEEIQEDSVVSDLTQPVNFRRTEH